MVIPRLFTRGTQRVFEYIWENPGCMQADMVRDLWPRRWDGHIYTRNLVSVHLNKIRRGLRHTEYRVLGQPAPRTGKQRRPALQYKIIYAPRKIIEEPAHGTV